MLSTNPGTFFLASFSAVNEAMLNASEPQNKILNGARACAMTLYARHGGSMCVDDVYEVR